MMKVRWDSQNKPLEVTVMQLCEQFNAAVDEIESIKQNVVFLQSQLKKMVEKNERRKPKSVDNNRQGESLN